MVGQVESSHGSGLPVTWGRNMWWTFRQLFASGTLEVLLNQEMTDFLQLNCNQNGEAFLSADYRATEWEESQCYTNPACNQEEPQPLSSVSIRNLGLEHFYAVFGLEGALETQPSSTAEAEDRESNLKSLEEQLLLWLFVGALGDFLNI